MVEFVQVYFTYRASLMEEPRRNVSYSFFVGIRTNIIRSSVDRQRFRYVLCVRVRVCGYVWNEEVASRFDYYNKYA